MRTSCLILLLAALAGCADGPTEPELDQDEAPPGVLRGVVLDPSIQPLAGAHVLVMPGAFENTTDAAGRFEFAGLDPGTYTLRVSRAGFLNETLVAGVREGPNPVVKVILPVDSDAVAYYSEYHFRGFVECAVYPINWCAQVNIATGIVLCQYGLCLGNVTADRSLALHWLDGIPDFLQTEMIWESTQAFGDEFFYVVGGATKEELASGFAPAFNRTRGPSALMMTLSGELLAEERIGAERALLTQVHPNPHTKIPGGCVVYNPCGFSLHLLQDYEVFTHTFHGYQPPAGWRFSEAGSPPGPPE